MFQIRSLYLAVISREFVRCNYFQALSLTPIIIIRNASSKPTKILVLEKPEKFNPPSHVAKSRQSPSSYYGPQMTAKEFSRQQIKKYPNMMPPEGTLMHWFIHNKLIHMWISLGILTSLTVTVLVSNFKNNSPFADMLPDWHDLFLHPINFWRTVLEVVKLDTARTSAETAQKRKDRVDDVAKRAAYRKAHRLDQFEGIGGWTVKGEAEMPDSGMQAGDGNKLIDENDQNLVGEEKREKKPVKKWLGIW